MRMAQSCLHKYIHTNKAYYLKISWTEKIKIALDIAQGLQFLHQNHIIHCDMHSGNVLIDHVSNHFSSLTLF